VRGEFSGQICHLRVDSVDILYVGSLCRFCYHRLSQTRRRDCILLTCALSVTPPPRAQNLVDRHRNEQTKRIADACLFARFHSNSVTQPAFALPAPALGETSDAPAAWLYQSAQAPDYSFPILYMLKGASSALHSKMRQLMHRCT
jgi:hypothetical protein